MDRITDKSTNEELKSFIQKFKINLNNVHFDEKNFVDFLARCVNLTLGFTGQVWFYFLRGKLEDIHLPQGNLCSLVTYFPVLSSKYNFRNL